MEIECSILASLAYDILKQDEELTKCLDDFVKERNLLMEKAASVVDDNTDEFENIVERVDSLEEHFRKIHCVITKNHEIVYKINDLIEKDTDRLKEEIELLKCKPKKKHILHFFRKK